MKIDRGNAKLLELLAEAMSDRNLNGYNQVGQNFTGTPAEARGQMSMPTTDDSFLGVSREATAYERKFVSGLVGRLVRSKAAQGVKTLLGANAFGTARPQYSGGEGYDAMQQARIAESCVWQAIAADGSYREFVWDMVMSYQMRSLFALKVEHRRSSRAFSASYSGVDLQGLDALQSEKGLRVDDAVQVSGAMAQGGLMDAGALFDVSVTRVVDDSSARLKVVDDGLLIDTRATCYADLSVIGEVKELTRQQIRSAYADVFAEAHAQKLLDKALDVDDHQGRAKVWDVNVAVEDRDDPLNPVSIVRAVAVGSRSDIAHVEDVGMFQYIPVKPDGLPGGMDRGTCLADRLAPIQDMLTDIERSMAMGAIDSLNVMKLISSSDTNIDTVLKLMDDDARVVAVDDPNSGVSHVATPYVGNNVVPFLQLLEKAADDLAGGAGELGVTEAMTAHEIMAREERSASIAEMEVNAMSRHLAQACEVVYHNSKRKDSVKAVYDEELGDFHIYDMEDLPESVKFDPVYSYAGSFGSRKLKALESVLSMQQEMMQGGLPLVGPQNVLNAGMDYLKEQGITNPGRYLEFQEPTGEEGEPSAEERMVQIEEQKNQLQAENLQLNREKAGVDVQLRQQDLDLKARRDERAAMDSELRHEKERFDQWLDRERLREDLARQHK